MVLKFVLVEHFLFGVELHGVVGVAALVVSTHASAIGDLVVTLTNRNLVLLKQFDLIRKAHTERLPLNLLFPY